MSPGRIAIYCLLIASAAWFLFPLYVMVSTSFKDAEQIRELGLLAVPRRIDAEAWPKAWSSACIAVNCEGLRPFFWNSIVMTVPSVAVSTAIGSINGYALSKWQFRGSDALFALMLFGIFLPLQVVLLPMSQVLGWMGLASTLTGLIIVHIVAGLPMTSLFFRNYYVSVPDELIKAGQLDGAGFWKIYTRIVLPISAPIIVVVIIWQFTHIWNDFLIGVVLASVESQPITVALNNLVNSVDAVKEYNVDMAAALLTALPTLIVYVLSGKFFLRGLTAGAIKG